MKAPLHIREINRAREWYNPLRGLDVRRVIALLEEGERGRYAELQKLNRMAEKRHPTLRALKHRRLSALKKLDWDIKVPSELPRGVTAAQAEAQRVFLRERYEAIENLTEAIEHLALATFRGFAHLEQRHEDDDPSLPIVRLEPVPQWHWVRDPDDFAVWRYDAEARNNDSASVPIDRAGFLIREVDDPICEIALLCYLRRNFAKKNWTAFQEDYAIPSIFATLGENTPPELVKEWLGIVKEVTNNSRGALPPGATVTPLELGKLDGVQFENFIKAEDSDLVLAGTSGLLTMLTADTGMNGDSQSGAHEDTFAVLAIAEAMDISALFQAQHDKPLLKAEFPSQKPVAYFQLAAEDAEDLDALAERLAKLRTAGFTAQAEELSEKFGLTLESAAAPAAVDPVAEPSAELGAEPGADPAAPLKNRKPGKPLKTVTQVADAGRQARFMAASEAALAAADRAVLAPLINRITPIRAELARLADLDDAGFAAGMEALRPQLRLLQGELPALEKEVLTGRPDLEETFSDILGTAFVSGVIQGGEIRQIPAKKGAKTE